MPREARKITRDDIISNDDYKLIRAEKRAENVVRKRKRQIAVGPYVTVTFECWDSMWLQIQDMLYIEKGGEAQIEDELRAYNPMVPNGRELTCTLMFEIDDKARREKLLGALGGVEDTIALEFSGHRIKAMPEGDVERSKPGGKTSSVHFLHFPFTDEQIKAFKEPGTRVTFVIGHEGYSHMAVLPEETRATLAEDFA
ncbi:MAG: DUF3501 family protein [Alphaproteobacteria bacterium]|nr:MAG: DUF3501 family protein [Alphaproteobacteria bacterium]